MEIHWRIVHLIRAYYGKGNLSLID